ncbi:MAG: tetratricopeptide repeat protein, partial [Gemmatimonadota bacterium]
AVELFVRLGNRDGEARTRRRLAAIREDAGEDEAALAEWDRLRTLCRESGDGVGELEAAERIVRLLRGRGETVRALDACRGAASLAASLGRPVREATLRNTVGIIEWERGEYEAARAEYERALAALERTDDRVARGLILNSLGVTLSSLGRHREAAARLESGIAWSRAHGRRRWEAHGLAALGDARLALGDRDAARDCFRASLAIRREIGDRPGERRMLDDLARLASDGDDEGD